MRLEYDYFNGEHSNLRFVALQILVGVRLN